MEEKIRTATGKTFHCDYFNPFPTANQVNLRVLGVSLVEAATVFSNPKETVLLFCGNQYLSQHTKIVAIVPEGNAIRIVLGKE